MRVPSWPAAASALLLALCACHRPASPTTAEENQSAGSRAFWPDRGHVGHQLEGYALRMSVSAGDTLSVALSAEDQTPAHWTLHRMGHYGGAGGRLMARGHVLVDKQRPCPVSDARGLLECDWSPTLQLQTEATWAGGVYLFKVVSAAGAEAYVPFVLHDGRKHEVIMALPTATWAAYNAWGGQSLYADASAQTGGHSFVVSYDKPFESDWGAGELFRRDHALLQWLEAQDLDLGYATSEDLDQGGSALLQTAKALVLSGHDEYWTGARRDAVEEAVAKGVSLLSLGANQAYWQVRLEPAADGRERRRVVCYKLDGRKKDPVGQENPGATVRFRDLGRPENALFGVMYDESWSQHDYPLVVKNAAHWALAGTGLKEGDVIARAHGDEVDQLSSNSLQPEGVEVIAESPFLNLHGLPRKGHMVVRKQGSALVFAAGGTDFVKTLSSLEAYDQRAGRIVANVLYRALGRAAPPSLPVFDHFAPPPAGDAFARDVGLFAGVPGKRGSADGARGVGTLTTPVALAAFPDGSLAIADAATRKLRRASPSGELTTLPTPPLLGRVLGLAVDKAGNLYAADNENGAIVRLGADGSFTLLAGANGVGGQDGPGTVARFSSPQGLALLPDGSALLVADLLNHSIRRVDLMSPDFTVSTVASNLGFPSAVLAAPDGTVLVAEMLHDRLLSISPGAPPKLVAGGIQGFNEGMGSAARFQLQFGLALLPDGSIAVADPANYRVRQITGGLVTTLAGSGRAGHARGPGHKADLVLPAGLATTPDGRVFVAEAGAGTISIITP